MFMNMHFSDCRGKSLRVSSSTLIINMRSKQASKYTQYNFYFKHTVFLFIHSFNDNMSEVISFIHLSQEKVSTALNDKEKNVLP